jgi:hypothetical protein
LRIGSASHATQLPDTPPNHTKAYWLAAIAAAVCLFVYWIYAPALRSHFFNDDFQWLEGTFTFTPSRVLHLDQYDHFYRPVIELYFYGGRRLFGCSPFAFHVASTVVHLLTTLAVFLLGRALTGRTAWAAAAALLFAVQSGPVEAVAWVGAITDLLPSLWYVLALWTHARSLQTGSIAWYLATIAAFTTCLLTHESSATLLPVMMALELACQLDVRGSRAPLRDIGRRLARYAPFAALLAANLATAWIVNSRSYLVREGHYAFGWHAVPHMFQYVVSLYIGKRTLLSYLAISAAAGAILARGSAHQRFLVIWLGAALAPASFFTWGNASRYLYLAAAPFALLLADLVRAAAEAAERRLPRRIVSTAAILLVAALTIRFAVFARRGVADFRKRTVPYERLIASTRASNPGAIGPVVHVNAEAAAQVPAMYVQPAIRTAYCTGDVSVDVR